LSEAIPITLPPEYVRMTGYRHNFVAGGCFFFTINLADRRHQLLTENIDALRTALRETQRHHPFSIDAIIVFLW
jgi:putative transposase